LAPKATEYGYDAVYGHSVSTISVPIENDFLLVNNTNLHPIFHRFQVITDHWSKFCFRQQQLFLDQ